MKSKKKVINILKIGVFLFGISLFLWNCEKENDEFIGDNQNIILIEKVKSIFKTSFNKSKFSKLPQEPLWKEASMFYYESGKPYMEIPFKIPSKQSNLATSISFDRLLASVNNQGEIELKIAHFFVIDLEKGTPNFNKLTHHQTSYFNGFITFFDIKDRKVLNSYRYKEGKKINTNVNYRDITSKEDLLLLNKMDEDCSIIEYTCERTCLVVLNSSGDIEETMFCSGWDCYPTGSYPSSCSGGDGGHSSGGGSYTSYETNTEEIKIINDELTGKAKCLDDKLNKNGNTFVKNILSKFQGNSKFDINIKSVDKIFRTGTTVELNGKTTHIPGSSLINIQISTDKLSDMPALGAARTIIHEYIHADMYRKINTTNYDGDLDFKTTYEKYETEKQHNSMAELYVNSIRDALKGFHKSVLVGDYNHLTNNGTNPLPDSFYEALAWQGLKEHNVKAYADLSSSKKTELTNALNTHYHSTTKNCSN